MQTQPTIHAEPSPPRITGTRLVQIYGAILVTAAALIWALALRDLHPLASDIEVRWWWLVPAFGLTEVLVIHLDVNRQAQTLSLSEIPLVIGLFFAAPAELVAAQAVGIGLALVLYRRQSALKVVFNLGQTALVTMVAISVFRALLPAGEPSGWSSWIAALAATATADVVAAVFVGSAIGFLARWTVPGLASFLGLGAIATFANAGLGLLGVELVGSGPLSVVLLLIPILVTYLAYSAFWREHRRSQHFEFLYESMCRLNLAPGPEEAITQLLLEARAMFHADVSAVVLLSDNPAEPARRSVLSGDNDLELLTPIQIAGSLVPTSGPLFWPAKYGRPRRKLELLGREVRDAIAIELHDDERMMGAIVVADRAGDVNTFTQADLQFLETFGTHAVVALEKRFLQRSVGELSQVNSELARRALHDPLTHLANRVLFMDRLEHALSARDPDGSFIGVLFVDLDNFKTINDTHGHEAGDRVLIAVAERLRACLRPSDTAARLGGDEFTILLESVQNDDEVEAVSTRILQALAVPVSVGDTEVPVNASIGQTISQRIPGSSAALLAQADSAMYVAKSHGKGRWVAAHAGARTVRS